MSDIIDISTIPDFLPAEDSAPAVEAYEEPKVVYTKTKKFNGIASGGGQHEQGTVNPIG